MRRPKPSRQQGFGLLVFVVITMVVALSIVIGYSGVMTRIQANALPKTQEGYIRLTASQIKSFYAKNAYQMDDISGLNNPSFEEVAELSGIRFRYGLEGAISRVLVSQEGMTYRAIAIWLPTESDSTNRPDLAKFRETGVFVRCPNAAEHCDNSPYMVLDSLEIHREAAKVTANRLQNVAYKAQAYFKARTLQDPEKNISVNYFHKPHGACNTVPQDLGCMPQYVPAVTLEMGTLTVAPFAINLGLSTHELMSGWGKSIEASNILDSVTDDTPFAMSFRARMPNGRYLSVKAIQQI